MITNITISNHNFKIALGLIILIQVVLAFQGFDMVDDGFVLTFYQQIFNHPESVEYNFMYWFSGVVGGLWYQLYPEGGVFWFRMLSVIVNTSTFMLSYQLLKKYVPNTVLLLALIMVLFENNYGFSTFYHNHLTALLCLLTVFTLVKAIERNSAFLYMLTGVLIIFNSFTRLPNVVMLSLLLGIPYFCVLYKKRVISNSIKPIVLVILGSVVGLLAVYGILLATGQFKVMKDMFVMLLDLGNTDGSAHNFGHILKAQFYNYQQIARTFVELSAILGVAVLAQRFLPKHKLVTLILGIFFVSLLILWYEREGIGSVYTLSYIGSIWILFSKKRFIPLKLIALCSFLILFTLTLGTGGGIKNSGYMAIWLGLPLFFLVLPELVTFVQTIINKILPAGNSMESKPNFSLLWCFILAFILLKGYHISNQAYFDEGSRLDKTHAIQNKFAKGVYTKARRAKIVNDLLAGLRNYVEPNDYLFSYDHIPMIHFLTETRPYPYNSWVGIYDENSFRKKIEKAEKEIPVLPIVVQQKFNTIYRFAAPDPDYMNPESANTILHSSASVKIMNSFLERHHYTIVWSNDYFNIYKAETIAKAH